jgi:hypothetical protein
MAHGRLQPDLLRVPLFVSRGSIVKKLILVLALAGAVFLAVLGVNSFGPQGFDINRLLNPGLFAKFGNFGGLGRTPSGLEPFDAKAIKYGIRWFPTYVNFGPDNDTLLVSLCHVDGPGYCRIGKYSLSRDQWDIYAHDELRTYRTPTFSPDGKWIYYSATQLCEDRRNFCDHPKLYRMKPDGSGVEMFADVLVVSPTFSVDGKRMIYWGQRVDPTTGARSLDTGHLYYLDMETRQIVRLTDRVQPISEYPPFLTPDGEHFIFAATLSSWEGQTSCATDPKDIPTDPKTGKKDFGPLFGDRKDTGTYLASIKDAPINMANCHKLSMVWPEEKQPGGPPCAMDGQGRFLYTAELVYKKRESNPVALALRLAEPNYRKPLPLSIEEERRKYPFASLTDEQLRGGDGARLLLKKQLESNIILSGNGPAAFLRRIETNAPDEAAFDIGCGDSLSRNGRQLAFLWGSVLPLNNNGVAVLNQGDTLNQVRLILNWPKLELKPTVPANR